MIKPIVLLDLDGVMIDHNDQFLQEVNEMFGKDYVYDDIVNFDYSFMEVEERTIMFALWEVASYDGKSLSVENQDNLKALRTFARVVACSTAFTGHIESKHRFLRRYFEPQDIVICKDKALVGGDILVDDKPKNIKLFRDVGKHGIVFNQPWNQDVLGPRAMDFESIGPCVVDYMIAEGIHDFGL